jgi:8-hydroxy-5-deazaflavin:NADPH oxidoreductase
MGLGQDVCRKEITVKIGIIGAGNIGGTLGEIWEARGHDVLYGVREGSDAPGRCGSIAEAASHGEVVVLAVPWAAAQDALREAGRLEGKVLVDCTNGGLDGTSSGAEKIARWASGARVVKAFNQAGWETLKNSSFDGHSALTLVAGDDADARGTVLRLGREVGLDMRDAGALANAGLLESLAALWIHLAFRQGLGRGFAFGLLRR